MNPAVIDREVLVDKKVYHTVKEVKNGQGAAPIKTDKGWLHIAHGVRNTAAGLRYVIYAFMTALDRPEHIIHAPAGHLIAPEDIERVGDVSNVVFCNGVIRDGDNVYIYYCVFRYANSRRGFDRRQAGRLLRPIPPEDPLRSRACVDQRCELIERNLKLMETPEYAFLTRGAE